MDSGLNKRIAVVGGAGYVGQNLSVSLDRKGYAVLVIDNTECPSSLRDIEYAKANITDESAMRMALSKFAPTMVIHLASMGMSGSAMLSPLCKTVNVHGTSKLVDICIELGIPNLIYTSSYNVVYGGKPIINGTESLPYFPLDQHTDQYGPTKALAERLVLKANGKQLRTGGNFQTSCIRPAAIYGEEEQRHFPRIVKHIDNGLFQFRIGSAMVDWVDVTNLVLAYELLIEKMHANKNIQTAPAGQAYCISDGTPIENFEFLRPLCAARGKKFPVIQLPTAMMLHVAHVLEILFHVTNALGCPVEPFLTRAEVLKVGFSHYFSIDKAACELGYKPQITSQQGGEKVAARYRKNLSNEEYFDLPTLPWWVSILLGMGLLGTVAYCDPVGEVMNSAIIRPVNQLALTLFGSQRNLQYLFVAAVATHALEACAAMRLARVEGCTNTWMAWGVQTFILGYPSMQLLYRRRSLLKKVRAEK